MPERHFKGLTALEASERGLHRGSATPMRRKRISDIIPKVTDEELRAQRIPLDADVTFIHPTQMHGVALDANEGGMSVVTDQPLEPGTRCIAVVQLADGEETHERMRVVWSKRSNRGWITGLAFAS